MRYPRPVLLERFWREGISLLLFALFSSEALAAPKSLVEKRTPFFTVTREKEEIERRKFDVFSADFDLSSSDLEIKASAAGDSILEVGRVEKSVDLDECLLAVGTGTFANGEQNSPRTVCDP